MPIVFFCVPYGKKEAVIKTKVFKDLLVRIAQAETETELNRVVFGGMTSVDMAYINGDISRDDLEIIYALTNVHKANKHKITTKYN